MCNNLNLETISCPLCQNEEQDVAFDQFSPYNIARCCSCGFYYLSPKRGDYIYEGGIDQVPGNEKFDCIVAVQVMEHVYQPKLFLKDLYKHLKPGGKIVIATPDMGIFWCRLMGHHWPSFKIPEHILFFTERSLSALMRQGGLVQIKSLPYPHAFPLPLVAAKLHISLPPGFCKFNIWLLATTIAMYGVSADGQGATE